MSGSIQAEADVWIQDAHPMQTAVVAHPHLPKAAPTPDRLPAITQGSMSFAEDDMEDLAIVLDGASRSETAARQ